MTSVIQVEPELGPSMLAITEMQRRFVLAVVASGAAKPVASYCARIAGYQGDENALRVAGHRLIHNPKVRAAIVEISRGRLEVSAAQSVAVLKEALTSTDEKLRVKAAGMLLDRCGIGPQTEHRVHVEHHVSREEKVLRLYELTIKDGRNPRDALGDLIELVPEDVRALHEGGNGE